MLPNCPKCDSPHTYEDRDLMVCPECSSEWSTTEPDIDEDQIKAKDANGNLLVDGDTVTLIKDLKLKGTSTVVKIGTKVTNIRLVEGDHNIDCSVKGYGDLKLKSEFVKKA